MLYSESTGKCYCFDALVENKLLFSIFWQKTKQCRKMNIFINLILRHLRNPNLKGRNMDNMLHLKLH